MRDNCAPVFDGRDGEAIMALRSTTTWLRRRSALSIVWIVARRV
jgi:hypothetical protein